jgi:hypothetical protein
MKPSIRRIPFMVAFSIALAIAAGCSRSGDVCSIPGGGCSRVRPSSGVVPPGIIALEKTKPANWEKARDKGVDRLVELAQKFGPKTLGFDQVPDRKSLTLLDPLPNAMVMIEDLRVYEATTDPAKLLRRNERLTFPILQGDKVKSSITLSKVNNAWKAVSYGEPKIIVAAMDARVHAVCPKTEGDPVVVNPGKAANYTMVFVPGLNRYFLAAEGPPRGKLYLIPLFSHAGFEAGVPLLARDAFLKLRPFARFHNGQPT